MVVSEEVREGKMTELWIGRRGAAGKGEREERKNERRSEEDRFEATDPSRNMYMYVRMCLWRAEKGFCLVEKFGWSGKEAAERR